jgi:penicillin-binding protein 2
MHSGLLDANTTFLDQGTYKLQTIEESVCASGVRCVFKNATNRLGNPTQYGEVTVEDALAVSSDAFFYKLGEDFYRLGKLDNTFPLKEDLERFGFGSESGIELPFEWDGRIPDDAVKEELVRLKVLGKNEEPRLLVGDNVQVSIGQGLMAATPLQLSGAYATIANGGFLMKAQIVKARYAPLTPDLESGMADLTAGIVVESFDKPVIRDVLEMPETEIREPIVTGLRRVIIGPGTEYPEGVPHAPTGFSLFKNYPESAIPIAGKTGTVQGAKNYPWNDSSAFGAFSIDPAHPYTIFAYLEKSGYGSKAAAPVVKCLFLALSQPTRMAPVLTNDPLDLNSTVAAPAKELADPSCLNSAGGGRG